MTKLFFPKTTKGCIGVHTDVFLVQHGHLLGPLGHILHVRNTAFTSFQPSCL